MHNVLKARKVVPDFFKWSSDPETVTEFNHEKKIIFIRLEDKKLLSKSEQKGNRKVPFS